MFGSSKQLANCPLGLDENSHCLDRVNFFRPWESISGLKPDIVEDVHVQQPPSGSNDSLPLLNQGGLELKENICVDG